MKFAGARVCCRGGGRGWHVCPVVRAGNAGKKSQAKKRDGFNVESMVGTGFDSEHPMLLQRAHNLYDTLFAEVGSVCPFRIVHVACCVSLA